MKTCIITGANSGIGRQAAEQIAAKGWRVILICRNLEACQKSCQEISIATGNDHIHSIQGDLSSLSDVQKVVNEFMEKYHQLDVLINNAADFDLSRKLPIITEDGLEKQFATNVMAPYILTNQLLPLLAKSDDGRVVNISSQGLMLYPNLELDFDNLAAKKSYSPAKTYYQNKLALLMNSYSLREQLQGTSVSVYGVRVTNVKIDMSRYTSISPFLKFMYKIKSKFSISPSKMAEVYTALTAGPKLPGFLYDEKLKEVQANKFVYLLEPRKRLIEKCEGFSNQLSKINEGK